MNKAIVADCETTGNNDPQVIEYGSLEVELVDGVLGFGIGHTYRFKPSKPIELGAIATHGILDSDLENCEPFSLEAVNFDADYLVGQNIDYDWSVMGKPACKRIDTLALARKLLPDIDSHKLMALVAFYDPQKFRSYFSSAHSVVTDVRATAFVLGKLVEAYRPTDMEDLWRMSENARIPEIMSFSKFKGQHVSEVDWGWRDWYKKQEDPDPFLLKAFDKYPYRKP